MQNADKKQPFHRLPPALAMSVYQPSAHKAAFTKAAEAFWEGDHASARKLLNPILREDPQNGAALRLLVKSCDEGNPAPSLRANAGRLIEQGAISQDRTILRKAFTLVHLAQAYDPRQQHDAHHYHLARIADAEGDKEKALAHLDKVFEVNALHTKSLELLACMQMQEEPDNIEEYETLGGLHAPFTELDDEEREEIAEIRDGRPSPAGSEPAELSAAINAMNMWDIK